MRFIVLFTVFVVAAGYFLHSGQEVPYLDWVGHLPGDLVITKEGATLYFPLTTSLIASVLLSLVLGRFWKVIFRI